MCLRCLASLQSLLAAPDKGALSRSAAPLTSRFDPCASMKRVTPRLTCAQVVDAVIGGKVW